MTRIAFVAVLLAWTLSGTPQILHAAGRLGGGEPIDRGTDGMGWCPSTHPNLGGSAPFNGAFTADGPTITVRFTAAIFHFDNPGWRYMNQRIDNLSLVTQATYNTYLDSLQCGPDFNLPTLYFNRVPPGQFLYFEQFHASLPAAWDTTQRAFYVNSSCGCSAPISVDNQTTSGGSLGLGRATDPHGAFAVTGITIGGLTAGQSYNLSYWWNSAGDSGPEGDLFVDILGTEYWAGLTMPALVNPDSTQGVAWGDYDRDGDPDLCVAGKDFDNRVFRNDAGSFADVSAGFGLSGARGRSVGWIDYDNDGDLDLYVVVAFGPNKLLRNDGAGFSNVTFGPFIGTDTATGLDAGQAWADYDRDGDLDAFVTANVSGGQRGRLLRNDGPTSFVDVAVGTQLDDAYSTATWGDFDNDGDPDLYAADSEKPRIFRNDGGVLASVSMPTVSLSAFCGAWGDGDNDGDLDLYLARSPGSSPRGQLIRNDGAAGFVDVSTAAVTGTVTGVDWLDVDLDADLDLLVTRGAPGETNVLLLNQGNGTFDPEGAITGPLSTPVNTHGSAAADPDGDGDLDLFEGIHGSPASRLFRNDTANLLPLRHWLLVDLRGTQSNHFGVGAQIRVVTGSTRQLREVTAGSGYYSQDDLTAHFGLGAATQADSVVVRWPSGIVQLLTNVSANQRLTIYESDPRWTSVWYAPSGSAPNANCWGGYDLATPEDPTLSNGALTLSTSQFDEDMYYSQTSFLSVPQDTFRISARLRVVSETHQAGNARRGVQIFFAVAPDSFNVLCLGHDSVHLWSALSVQGPTAAVDTDNQLHDYLIEIINHQTIRVYQDGTQILTGAITTATSYVSGPYLWWGDGTGATNATSEWVYVRHNASTFHCGAVTGIGPEPDPENPVARPVVSLAPPFPNPSRGELTFSIHADRDPGDSAVLEIYDVAGRLVRKIETGRLSAGTNALRWDGLDARGESVSSGLYLYRLAARGQVVGSGRATILR